MSVLKKSRVGFYEMLSEIGRKPAEELQAQQLYRFASAFSDSKFLTGEYV